MKQKSIFIAICLFVLLAINRSTYLYGQEYDKTWTDTFLVDKESFISSGSNLYFNLTPGYQLKLEGKEGIKLSS